MSSDKDSKDLKEQRDRLLAFAFAGADLMIEVDANGIITYSLGAARGMTGTGDGKLTGKNDLFAPRDRGMVAA